MGPGDVDLGSRFDFNFEPINPVSALSTIAGYNMSSRSQKEANWSSAQQAHDARTWAENMRATAHQATVSDLRKAGLNPLLSATHGVNPTPSSAVPKMESHGASAAQAGREFAMQQADLRNRKMDTNLKSEQRWQAIQQTEAARQAGMLTAQQILTEKENTRGAQQTADILTSDAKGRALEGQIDESSFGEWMRYINRALQGITGAASAFRNFGLGRGGSEAPAPRGPRLRIPPGY